MWWTCGNRRRLIVSRDCNKRGGGRGEAGAASSLMSDCNKMGRMGRVGTWNVRSFGILGKLSNVMNEMKRMGVGIMGVAETCCDKEKEWTFTGKLPESEGGEINT